ncbi:MAG TPA: AsmA family protein [Silvibacterium sp.]|nr:AsmA family protein [Silvibacterium sp.]
MISQPPIPVEAPTQSHRARWIVAALVFLLVLNGLLLPLISLGGYHRTIADSLTRSLGHTVHLRSVNLAVFPLPGLVIHDLTVEEDPSFGAEPLLHAPTVTVFLRVSSLWRQRLEISRINLENASVNLARDPSGRWNFSSLLLQASRTPTAPTAQRRPSSAPRFPYIEFSAARINFKEGAEKKALSFLNADASVWLANPNQWHIRFAAQPARTDLNLELADTGVVRLEGSLTRASSISELPLDLHAEWTGAQLGQASRLMLGSDSQWRGDLRVQADITGTISDLALRIRLSVSGAHRVEFTPLHTLDIDAACDATYRRDEHLLDHLTCLLPTGDGHLLLTGSVRDLTHPRPRLNLEINHTPASLVLTAIGLVRSTLPPTLSASGTINGSFDWAPQVATAQPLAQKTKRAAPATPNLSSESAASQNILTGHAVAEDVSIDTGGSAPPVTFAAALRFSTPDLSPERSAAKSRPERNHGAQRARLSRTGAGSEAEEPAPLPEFSTTLTPPAPTPGLTPLLAPSTTILLEPATFPTGFPIPMQVTGQFSRSGFSLHFTGASSLARLQPLLRNLAQFHTLAGLQPKGTAQSDLIFAGPWLPSTNPETGAASPAIIQGWTRVQHAAFKPAWLPDPLEIATATAQFANGTITWTNANVTLDGISAKASASSAATCLDPAGCPAEVTLDLPSLDAAALQSALLGAGRGEFLNAILSTVESPAPPWPPLNATLRAATLTAGRLKFSNARATISVRDHRVHIVSFDAATLGGSAHITGTIEPSSDGPNYALNITGTGLKLADAADLFNENWGPAAFTGQLALNLHGYSGLAASATGDFRFNLTGKWGGDWAAGHAPNQADVETTAPAPDQSGVQSGDSSAPVAVPVPTQWTAAGTIAGRTLTFTKGPAQGTIAFDRTLNLIWNPKRPRAQEQAPSKRDGRHSQTSHEANAQSLQITGSLSHPVSQAVSPEPLSEPLSDRSASRTPRNN